jgi:hypothetical protein
VVEGSTDSHPIVDDSLIVRMRYRAVAVPSGLDPLAVDTRGAFRHLPTLQCLLATVIIYEQEVECVDVAGDVSAGKA